MYSDLPTAITPVIGHLFTPSFRYLYVLQNPHHIKKNFNFQAIDLHTESGEIFLALPVLGVRQTRFLCAYMPPSFLREAVISFYITMTS